MTALTDHLLQSTLFAAAVVVLALAFRGERARTCHWLWMAASAKFLIPFSLLLSLSGRISWRTVPAAPAAELTFVMAEIRQPVMPAPAFPAPPSHIDWQSYGIWTIWLGGSAALLVRWHRRWKKMAAAVHEAMPAPNAVARALERVDAKSGRIAILSSAAFTEPGVFGIFHPILVLPAGIEERLSGAQLESVLSHELCHIRRHDNLAAAIHMLVESLFWFHPLVWWLGARLVEERELACDEEVLERGADPELYAQSILKVCEFCCESGLPCVSGITGADLERRILNIMTPRLALSLPPAKKLLLTLCGIAAFAGPIAMGLLHPSHIRAQAPTQTAQPLSFEVASVKPVDQPWLQVFPQRSGGRITWTTDLHYLVGYAYHLSDWRISGPLPGSDHIYAFDVTTSPSATEDQVRLMFQSLLADRFKMAAHRVTKDVEGYALTVAKGGLKIKPVTDDDRPADLPEWFRKFSAGDMEKMENKVVATIPTRGVVAITGRRATMLQLTESLQKVLRVSVLDKTGLSGKYYFGFEFAQEDHPEDAATPSLTVAIQKDLGLKLEKHKGPVEMLVIDHIERTPTEN